jgi:hypothetical protein
MKWAVLTVMHSGTRYVITAFKNAGYTTTDEDSSDLNFIHFNHWTPVPADRTPFIVTRNPAGTLGTLFRNIDQWDNDRFLAKKESLKHHMLVGYNTQLIYTKKRPDTYIHRVEDPIENLGAHLGIELKDHDQRFSKPNGLQAAIADKDADEMERIMGKDMFNFFRSTANQVAPLYVDQLGYDYWWLK